MTTTSPSQISILHSQKDQALAAHVASYINEYKLKGIINHYREVIVDNVAKSSLEKERLRKSRDIFFIIASPNFLKSDFIQSTLLKELISNHNLKRNLMIPVFFYQPIEGESGIHRLTRLKTNAQTIVFHSHSELHQQLIPIFKELEPLVGQWTLYNEQIDEAWSDTRKAHDYDTYLNFQKNYPLSVYSLQAKAFINDLIEEKLWKEAVSFDKMKYYYEYLANAPHKKYEEACIKKILEIESRQEVAQVDALKNQNIALALDFKGKYDRRNYNADIDKHLFQLFDQPEKEIQSIETERYFLQHHALKNSSPEETLSLNLSLDYDQHLKGRLRSLIGKLQSFSTAYIMGFAISVFAFLYLFFYYTLSIFQEGQMNLGLFLAYVALAYLAYRCIMGYQFANKCVNKHKNILRTIERDYIYLQVAAISKDQESTRRIQFNMANTSFNLTPYEQTTLFSFIGMSEEIEMERQQQQIQLLKKA